MSKKLIFIWLSVIILVSFIEIAFYFIYIFKPVDRFAGRDIGVPRGIPQTSELFTPSLLNQYVTQNNEIKKFYSERLSDFTALLKPKMLTKSGFVKSIEANYTVSGKVFKITPLDKVNGSPFVAYDITLENYSGDKYYDHLDAVESQYLKVSIRNLAIDGKNFTKSYATLADVKEGDTLIIKRSTNLLNPLEVNIEAEILRIDK